MKTVHVTMAHALIKFLNNQSIEIDSKETKYVADIFGIFGYGRTFSVVRRWRRTCMNNSR